MMRILALLTAVAVPLAPLSAQETDAATGEPPQRVRSVTVYGEQACPKAEGDEIVVCSHLDADEQFRIPKELREPPATPANNSWVNKAEVIDDVSRTASGMPDSCSVIGTGGQTGCSMQMMRAWTRAKQAAKSSSAP